MSALGFCSSNTFQRFFKNISKAHQPVVKPTSNFMITVDANEFPQNTSMTMISTRIGEFNLEFLTHQNKRNLSAQKL